jgi:hypothetical protein
LAHLPLLKPENQGMLPVMAVARALIETSKAPSAKDLIPVVQAQQTPAQGGAVAGQPGPPT